MAFLRLLQCLIVVNMALYLPLATFVVCMLCLNVPYALTLPVSGLSFYFNKDMFCSVLFCSVNSLDPDQDRQTESKLFDTLILFLNFFLKKLNLPSMHVLRAVKIKATQYISYTNNPKNTLHSLYMIFIIILI